MLRVAALVGALLLAQAGPGLAQQPAPAAARAPQTATTQHQGRFNGQLVPYQAVVEEAFLNGQDGRPNASVITTSYIRSGVADPAKRPVLFLFNGGPGASTTPLHFGAFGPQRRIGEGEAQRLVENPDSLLDTVDLVFIDPVGTGYSRPFAEADGKQYWSRRGDARSVKQVIAGWLQRHGRQASPRYLLGQSYGTTRAALIVKDSQDLAFDGVLLLALVGEAEGREMPYVTSLPSYAAAAWHHNRIPRRGRTVEQVFDEALEFARTDYVTGLIKGASLPPAEKRRIAQRMSMLIGLPADVIEAEDLRLTNDEFMKTLLKAQGLRTGQLDARATRRLDAPAQRPPYDDPGLSFTLEATETAPSGTPDTPFASAPGGQPSALEGYYRRTLRFESPEAYNALNLDVNSAWDHEGRRAVAIADLGPAMKEQPKLRVFWAAGLYDLSTPAYRGRYALDQAGVPADRLVAARFPGGHSVFTEAANRRALAQAVRRFVAGGK